MNIKEVLEACGVLFNEGQCRNAEKFISNLVETYGEDAFNTDLDLLPRIAFRILQSNWTTYEKPNWNEAPEAVAREGLKDMINRNFNWSRTPEGNRFWSRIHASIESAYYRPPGRSELRRGCTVEEEGLAAAYRLLKSTDHAEIPRIFHDYVSSFKQSNKFIPIEEKIVI